MSNKNNKIVYVNASGEGLKDTYQFKKLSLREVRSGVLKLTSLLAPALGQGMDMYQEIQRLEQTKLDYEAECLPEPEVEDISVFPLATVIGTQLEHPVVIELLDILMEDCLKNGEPLDIDDPECDTDLPTYLRVVTGSFKYNLLNPLVACLTETGYSEIVGFAQTVLTTKLPTKKN